MTTTDSSAAASSNPYLALLGSNSNASSSTASGSSAASSASAAYSTFLTLLTTQLQHQDPMDPTKTDTFTSQMIQLSGVEQQLKANETLGNISSDLTSISSSNGLGYVGKTVTASGATVPLQSGTASWDYTLPTTASSVTLNVQNSSGATIYSTTGNPASGQHGFTWDGKGSDGTAYTSGDYTLSVSATNSAGDPVSTTTEITGKVTGVDTSTGVPQLQIGDVTVPVTSVTMING